MQWDPADPVPMLDWLVWKGYEPFRTDLDQERTYQVECGHLILTVREECICATTGLGDFTTRRWARQTVRPGRWLYFTNEGKVGVSTDGDFGDDFELQAPHGLE